MKRLFATLSTLMFLVCTSLANAAEQGTAEEAIAMVKRAIAFKKENGIEKTLEAVNAHQASFADRDLYIVITDMNGKNLAHGANPRMVGKELLEIKDIDGKFYMKERIEIVKSRGKGWQDYKFVNPVTKQIEAKSMYVEQSDGYIIGCGIYKK